MWPLAHTEEGMGGEGRAYDWHTLAAQWSAGMVVGLHSHHRGGMEGQAVGTQCRTFGALPYSLGLFGPNPPLFLFSDANSSQVVVFVLYVNRVHVSPHAHTHVYVSLHACRFHTRLLF